MGQLNITDDLTPTWRSRRGNCVQRAREACLLTRQLDASRMTDGSLNAEAQTGTGAWLHSCNAGLEFQGIFRKKWWHSGIDQTLARRTDQGARIVDILPPVTAESRPPVLRFTRILQTVSPHCISSAIPLERSKIWLWRETLTALITPTGRSNYLARRLSWSAIPEWDVCLIIAASQNVLGWNNRKQTKRERERGKKTSPAGKKRHREKLCRH